MPDGLTRPIQWRTQYKPDVDEAHGQFTATYFHDPSLTQQQFKEDADLNVIVKRFGVTRAHIPPAEAADPRYYGDFGEPVDLREALDRTRAAQEHFDSLPAELRNRFNNDPVRLFGFVVDPKNTEEAIKLGLLHKAARQAPQVTNNQAPEVTNNVTPEAS